MKKKLVLFFATGGGLGYAPVASGTVGSLPGIPLAALLVISGMGLIWQVVVCLLLTVLAIPLCSVAEGYLGKKDDGRIVADEYLTFPICLLGLPWLEIEHIWLLPVCFVVVRICDIIKPPPARQFQELHGGTGIVLDDFFASVYALIINHAIWQLAQKFVF